MLPPQLEIALNIQGQRSLAVAWKTPYIAVQNDLSELVGYILYMLVLFSQIHCQPL